MAHRFGILLLVGLLFTSPVQAQEKNSLVFLDEIDSEIQSYLAKADEYQSVGDWRNAVTILQALLERCEGPYRQRVVPVGERPPGHRPRYYVGLRRELLDRLEALPEEGLDQYRAIVSSRAEARLEEARRSRDAREALRQVVIAFPLTRAAEEARRLLLDRSLEVGAFSDALACLQKGEPDPVARSFSWLGLGDPVSALSVIEDVEGERAAAIRAGALRRLERSEASFPTRIDGHSSTGLLYRGELPFRDGFEDWTKLQLAYGKSSGGRNRPSRVYPLHLGNRLLLNTPQGQRLLPDGGTEFPGYDLWNQPLEGYTLPLTVAATGPYFYMGLVDAQASGAGRLDGSYIRLRGFKDTRRLLWGPEKTFRRSEGPLEFLKEGNIVSPIVARGDAVYACVATISSEVEIYAVAFDAQTGTVRWHTFLCSAFTNERTHRQPVFDVGLGEGGGLLYAVTNTGVIVVLDLLSGHIRWIVEYPQKAIRPGSRRRRGSVAAWLRPTPEPIIFERKEGHVAICLPRDVDAVLALDGKNRRLLWEGPLEDGESARQLYFDGRRLVTLQTDRGLWTFEATTGKRLHRFFRLPGQAAGKGLWLGNRLLLPMKDLDFRPLVDIGEGPFAVHGTRKVPGGLWILPAEEAPDDQIRFRDWQFIELPPEDLGNLMVRENEVLFAADSHLTIFRKK